MRFGTNTAVGLSISTPSTLIRNVGLTNGLRIWPYGRGRPQRPAYLPEAGCSVDFAPRVKRGEAGYNGKPAVIISIQKHRCRYVTLTRRSMSL